MDKYLYFSAVRTIKVCGYSQQEAYNRIENYWNGSFMNDLTLAQGVPAKVMFDGDI